MNNESRRLPELFGSMVFDEETMKDRLSPACYKAWKKSVTDSSRHFHCKRDRRGNEAVGSR